MDPNNPYKHMPQSSCVMIPPPPCRFSLNEWYLHNRSRDRIALDQQCLADSIRTECNRVREVIEEQINLNKKETDHKIDEKLKDIDFIMKEINIQKKEVGEEIRNLSVFSDRIFDTLKDLNKKAIVSCKKCLCLRETRLGIDLCHDDVERELFKELEVIEGAIKFFNRLNDQAQEQVRLLRSTEYFMDRDLTDKENAFKIDQRNQTLKETSLNLSMYHGFTPLDIANITKEEWEERTKANIEKAAKEVNVARHCRSLIDTILKQVIDDLRCQFYAVNEAFARRIAETREAKTKLEIQHAEILRQANEMTRTITELEKAITSKEGYMALAHTRLGNRAQREGAELCRDLVETQLVNEAREIRVGVSQLQMMLAQAQASLRYLLKAQIQIEEDINIKINTLKIDEVDCMTVRIPMEYFQY